MSVPLARRQGFLSALLYPDYRYLWTSTVGVNLAMSMEQVVMGWLVLELTNSAALVGLVGACRFVGMALGPFLGALADRFDRRRILVIERAANVAYALAFVVLYYASVLEVWHIFVLALVGGVLRAVDFTIRNVMIYDTVESHNLTSAVGLIFAAVGISMIAGPLLGGYLFKPLGTGGSFLSMAFLYLVSYLSLLPMRYRGSQKTGRHESAWRATISGIRYVMSDKSMLVLMVLAILPELFSFPCVFGILSVFVRNVLKLGSEGLGWLTAAEGLGGFTGSLVSASLAKFTRKKGLLVTSLIIWSVSLGFLGGLRFFYVGIGLLVISGIARGISMSILQMLFLAESSDEMRGRVSGLRMSAIALLPVGNVISGMGAGLWGSDVMLVINGVAGVVTTVLVGLLASRSGHQK